MRALMIVLAFIWCRYGLQQPMEKQALVIAQGVSVSDLDEGLPASPFSSWFEQLVGSNSGVIWQLGECGRSISDTTIASTQAFTRSSAQQESNDIPACVEANAVLPDGRKVVVMIRVGSFKKGITDNPGFNLAMIEQEDELYLIKRLSDLPKRLSATSDLALAHDPLALALPVQLTPRLQLQTDTVQELVREIKNVHSLGSSSESDPPPPPPLLPPKENPVSKKEDALKNVLQGEAIRRVQPQYPATARMYNAAGQVRVQVDISETGRVTSAKAISGHPLLRDAAEIAARKWIFKPTTLDSVPVTTRIVLNFNFNVPD
jgi:TonB family protein